MARIKGTFNKTEMPKRYYGDEDSNKPMQISPFKMQLMNKNDMGDRLVFHYNPTTWTDTRSTEYESEEVSEWATDRPMYKKTGMRNVSFTLFFDDGTLDANMSSDIAGYNLTPKPKTHGQFWKESGKGQNPNYFSAPPNNPGKDLVGASGQLSTVESINWLREHSMTLPDKDDVEGGWPPVLVFTGLRQDGTTFGKINTGQRMFECVITKVDVTPLLLERINPWYPIRANIELSLDAFVDSDI